MELPKASTFWTIVGASSLIHLVSWFKIKFVNYEVERLERIIDKHYNYYTIRNTESISNMRDNLENVKNKLDTLQDNTKNVIPLNKLTDMIVEEKLRKLLNDDNKKEENPLNKVRGMSHLYTD